MNSNHKVVQWSCRGLKSNYSEILLLLSLLSPSVFCLQEAFLGADDQLNIRDFVAYNCVCSEGRRPSGGGSVLVHSSCPQREIELVTSLRAVAVSVTLDKEIAVCSVYVPPNFHLETEDLDILLEQLPSPCILVGDFNGHSVLWGCKDGNPEGSIVEDFIAKSDLCLVNDKSHTCLHPATGKFSSLDLPLGIKLSALSRPWGLNSHWERC